MPFWDPGISGAPVGKMLSNGKVGGLIQENEDAPVLQSELG